MVSLVLVLLLLSLALGVNPTPLAPVPGVALDTTRHRFGSYDAPVTPEMIDGEVHLLATPRDYVDWMASLPADLRPIVGNAVDPTFDGHFLVASTQWWCAQTTSLRYDQGGHGLIYHVHEEPDVDCAAAPGLEVFTVADADVGDDPATLTVVTYSS
ncbi:MAG: hypothetical protein GX596_04310 [Propionibacterium sp.]|nr:hypothetical protein [Propionibacterium sp.]